MEVLRVCCMYTHPYAQVRRTPGAPYIYATCPLGSCVQDCSAVADKPWLIYHMTSYTSKGQGL